MSVELQVLKGATESTPLVGPETKKCNPCSTKAKVTYVVASVLSVGLLVLTDVLLGKNPCGPGLSYVGLPSNPYDCGCYNTSSNLNATYPACATSGCYGESCR